ncbi:MAG: hypothetical protein ACTSSA_11815 [Candidatus Freyarchaeota archaeon]
MASAEWVEALETVKTVMGKTVRQLLDDPRALAYMAAHKVGPREVEHLRFTRRKTWSI